MKHCGKEHCEGQWCQNWQKCRGETIPPWTLFQFKPSTAAVSVREQDVLAAADALAEEALNRIACESKGKPYKCLDINGKPYCPTYRLCKAIETYQRERNGNR